MAVNVELPSLRKTVQIGDTIVNRSGTRGTVIGYLGEYAIVKWYFGYECSRFQLGELLFADTYRGKKTWVVV